MTYKGLNVNTSEKAYGYETAVNNNRIDKANDIMRAEAGLDVKRITKKIYKRKEWEKEKVGIMRDVIKAKAEQVKEVKEELMGSGGRIIAEAVPGDYYWSCGLDKETAARTNPEHWPGQNVLGKMWMALREEIRDQRKEWNCVGGATEKIKNTPVANNASKKTEGAKRKISDSATGGSVSSKPRCNGTTPPKPAKTKKK